MTRITQILILLCLAIAPSAAWANTGLLTLVTEVRDGAEPRFWWAGTSPSWTDTDAQLRAAFEREGPGFGEPNNLAKLSKIYRKGALSDGNAVAMASVLGHDRVLVGSATLTRSELAPLGTVGFTAKFDVRLLAATGSGAEVVSRIEISRTSWAPSEAEALDAARREASGAVARTLAGGMTRKTGPVGATTGELLLAFRNVGSTARLDAIRQALLGIAGVKGVDVRWATQGLIALEVNPYGPDSADTVRKYANLLGSEAFEGFSLVASQTTLPEVVEFRLVEVR